MKKSVGILCGLAVAIGLVTVGGAWYIGKQLPSNLEQGVAAFNQQLNQQLIATGGQAKLELVSLDQRFFTSSARYRLTGESIPVGQGEAVDFVVGVQEEIEHGPFPWSRVKHGKLMPVLAADTATLVKDDTTAPWFAAVGDQSPLIAHTSLGFGGGLDSTIHLLPATFAGDAGNQASYRDAKLRVSTDRDGKRVQFHGELGNLAMKLTPQDVPPVDVVVDGLTFGGEMASTGHALVYTGHSDLYVGQLQATFGPQQVPLLVKGFEQNTVYTDEGKDRLGGRLEYRVSDINYAGRAVGNGQMVITARSLDMPALQALGEWYQSRLPDIQAAAQQGLPITSVPLAPQEREQVHANLQRLLAAKPQVALESFTFKTANGESRFHMKADLTTPESFDLPSNVLTQQIIDKLDARLTLSKPMIGDLATLQALLAGQTDAQAIALQAGQAGEMLGVMAQQSGLATVEGDEVVSALRYDDGQIDFNGQKMSLEEFALLLRSRLGVVAPQG